MFLKFIKKLLKKVILVDVIVFVNVYGVCFYNFYFN